MTATDAPDSRPDPRTALSPGSETDIRPAVAVPRAGLPNWMIAVGIAAASLLLFTVLDARRRSASAPPVAPAPSDIVRTAPPVVPLYLPPEPVPTPVPAATIAPPAPPPPAPAPPRPPQIIYVPQPVRAAPSITEPVAPRAQDSTTPALVYDASTADGPTPGAAGLGAVDGASAGGAPAVASAARARRLSNRATTVAQGTLIPAVLESALDSTRPGPARALVTRNVRGADGSRVIIPRGSRLFGDYRADLAAGQNRALITWTRLVRPDGAAIALASPAADPLGRVGVRGRVDSHFLARFGAALLQSTLDIGVNLASRSVSSPVVVALPGTAQGAIGNGSLAGGSLVSASQAAPTLRIRQGVSISVFVARDLDFTSVQQR